MTGCSNLLSDNLDNQSLSPSSETGDENNAYTDEENQDNQIDGDNNESDCIGLTLSVQEIARKFYSTTSSVYAEHTISNPNTEQILWCVATVLQAQIFEDINVSNECKDLHPEFNTSPSLPPEMGGDLSYIPSEVLLRESKNDHELHQQLLEGNVPTADTIFSYLKLIKDNSGHSEECNIIALIYTNRITSMSSIALTMLNWRAIWAVSVILAQKMWDDVPLKTSAFAHILPSFSKQLLRSLEMKALTLLQFSTVVKPSLYAQYYFELRSLFSEIKGDTAVNSHELTLKPLSIIKARRLENRAKNIWKTPIDKKDKKASVKGGQHSQSGSDQEVERFFRTDSVSTIDVPAKRGWQASSPNVSAHGRQQMIGMHQKSKELNTNPYVFDERKPQSVPNKLGTRTELEAIKLALKSTSFSACGRSDDSRHSGRNASSSPSLSPCNRDKGNNEDGSGDVTVVATTSDLDPYTSASTPATNTNFLTSQSLGYTREPADLIVRTYEDITLTDTSRYVLS